MSEFLVVGGQESASINGLTLFDTAANTTRMINLDP